MEYDFSALILEAQQKMQTGKLEAAIKPLINALESYPIAKGAADALHLIGIIHMKTMDGHRCEISCLLAHRLRATLIHPGLEFNNLVNLTRACLNQKSFEEAYVYGRMAEKINNEDPDQLANMTLASALSGKESEYEVANRLEKLKTISPSHVVGVISILEGKSNINPTYHLSCDDLVSQFENIKKSGSFDDYKKSLADLLTRPDGINSWKCWRMVTEIHLAMKPNNPEQEYLQLQEMAGVAAASGKAIAFHPNNAKDDQQLWHWRGNSLGQMCLYDMAVEALEIAYQIDRTNNAIKDALDYCIEMNNLPPEDIRRPDSWAWIENRMREFENVKRTIRQCPKCGSNLIEFLGADMISCNDCLFIGSVYDAIK